mmetsp:Transcript_30365/g.59673  ORF Transcript_30365/g.59673 Transcript_30365/m.59673 type:complete len:111 (-) Transcript_30365:1024-1356(-)
MHALQKKKRKTRMSSYILMSTYKLRDEGLTVFSIRQMNVFSFDFKKHGRPVQQCDFVGLLFFHSPSLLSFACDIRAVLPSVHSDLEKEGGTEECRAKSSIRQCFNQATSE